MYQVYDYPSICEVLNCNGKNWNTICQDETTKEAQASNNHVNNMCIIDNVYESALYKVIFYIPHDILYFFGKKTAPENLIQALFKRTMKVAWCENNVSF